MYLATSQKLPPTNTMTKRPKYSYITTLYGRRGVGPGLKRENVGHITSFSSVPLLGLSIGDTFEGIRGWITSASGMNTNMVCVRLWLNVLLPRVNKG